MGATGSLDEFRDRRARRDTDHFNTLPFQAKVIIVNLVVVMVVLFAYAVWPDSGSKYTCFKTDIKAHGYTAICTDKVETK